MLATATISARLEQLQVEREQHAVRFMVGDHKAADRIAMLTAQLKAAKAERETARRNWEKNDQAYGALIGDYARLKADALADDAAAEDEGADETTDDRRPEPALSEAEGTEDTSDDQWQQLLDEAVDE